MVLFNNLVSPLWSRYWLRFQESYENVISSLTTSSAACPAPSGNVIISRSSSTLSLTSHLHFDSVCCSPLPAASIPYHAHICSLKRHSADYKRSCEEKEAAGQKKQSKANKYKQRGSSKITLDYAVFWISWPHYSTRSSLEIWGWLYLFSARLMCTIKPKTYLLSHSVECVFKNVQRTQTPLIVALEICPSVCSCC